MKNFITDLHSRLHGLVNIVFVNDDTCIIDSFAKDIEHVLSKCCDDHQVYYEVDENDDTFIVTFSYNACLICKKNLGFSNPRQLCKKIYCPMQ